MGTIRIKTRLESETLVLPEIRPLIGKNVEISVTEVPTAALDALIDWEYHDELEAEFKKDLSPIPPLEEVRAATSRIKGSMAAAIREERDERG